MSTAETTLPLKQTLNSLPSAPKSTTLQSDLTTLQQQGILPTLVILDDDPTGTQTSHNINVLTVWNHQTLLEEFQSLRSRKRGGFFILTNSRALHTNEARDLIHEICTAVRTAADEAGHEIEIVLRGDSTLRGHFPDEPEVAADVLFHDRGREVDGWILAPFFRQGGRLTINDVHYVADYGEDKLVPAAQTPFAKDATFGYRHSDLREYVVEKSKGRISGDRVVSVSLEDVRGANGKETVKDKLLAFGKGSVIVVNAVVDEDMEVFVQGLLEAQATSSKRYIYRTGAAFVSTRLGIKQIPPLTPIDLKMPTSSSTSPPGGLIIAGSYVPKTTSQLDVLIQGRAENLTTITIQVEPLLSSSKETADITIQTAIQNADQHIRNGKDVLIMTSRDLVKGDDEVSSLRIGSVVAEALVRVLSELEVRPRYVIAKGGITSSDAATKSLRMKRAEIVGQAASGVPLWECHEETSKWKGIPFVVFPGNVGEKETLRDLVASWAISDE